MNFPVNNNNAPAPVNRNAPVQGAAPTAPPKVTVIDGSNVQPYSAPEPTAFDAARSGMPPPGSAPLRSSPDIQAGLDELEQLMKTANTQPNSIASFSSVMAQVKMMALKNREAEMSVRDKLRLTVLDLKMQAIEKDREAASATLKSALFKGVADGVSAGINVVGGVKQMSMAAKGLSAGPNGNSALDGAYAQGLGMKYQGAAGGASAAGTMGAGLIDKEAADRRAEGETLRATSENFNQLLNQSNDRVNLNRELLLDTNSADRSINDATTQAANKRLSV